MGVVVANIRTSKIESKSQPYNDGLAEHHCCCKYKNFKDRKQITTVTGFVLATVRLLQI